MTTKRILLLGVGNILYGDEGLGVHAIKFLESEYQFSNNVSVIDGGTLGKLLMPFLVDAEFVLIVDAVLGREKPGTMYRLEGEDLRKSLGFCDSQHQVDLVDILISCDLMGKRPEAIVIGMEPQDIKTMQIEMTEAVKKAFPRFIDHILSELKLAGGLATPKK